MPRVTLALLSYLIGLLVFCPLIVWYYLAERQSDNALDFFAGLMPGPIARPDDAIQRASETSAAPQAASTAIPTGGAPGFVPEARSGPAANLAASQPPEALSFNLQCNLAEEMQALLRSAGAAEDLRDAANSLLASLGAGEIDLATACQESAALRAD